MNKIYPSRLTTGEEYTGNQAFKCPDCDGVGEVETGIGMMVCDNCGGEGEAMIYDPKPTVLPRAAEESIDGFKNKTFADDSGDGTK